MWLKGAPRGHCEHARTTAPRGAPSPEKRGRLPQEFQEHMAGLLAKERRQLCEPLLGMLIREHGDDPSTAELIGIADIPLIAARETTADMFGLGALALLRHPDQLALVPTPSARPSRNCCAG